jgi:hypothetical protein
MSTRTQDPSRELFRPQPESAWDVALVLLCFFGLFITAPGIVLLLALAAIFVYSKFAWNDVRTAIWLLRSDPYQGRGVSCFWFCLSRGVLKIVVVATSLALVVYNPFGWHTPIDWKVPAALLAGIVAHVALAIVGWRSAVHHRVRAWIDSGLKVSRSRHIWPPRCCDSRNEARSIRLVSLVMAVVFFLGLDSRALAFDSNGLLAVGVLVATLTGLLLLTRNAAAETPEDCWFIGV